MFRDVDGRIDQQLQRRHRPAFAFHLLADDRRKVPAHGITAYGSLAGRRAKPMRIGKAPLVRREAIIQPRREHVLRRQTVVDRQDRRLRALRQNRAPGMAGIEIADHAAAHVEIHDQRMARVLRGGPVKPRRNGITVRTRNSLAG